MRCLSQPGPSPIVSQCLAAGRARGAVTVACSCLVAKADAASALALRAATTPCQGTAHVHVTSPGATRNRTEAIRAAAINATRVDAADTNGSLSV
jgi:hypothetical protein